VKKRQWYAASMRRLVRCGRWKEEWVGGTQVDKGHEGEWED